ncbi:hypothetical protein MTO96_003582 [Rhipicephalus appendiculatus]
MVVENQPSKKAALASSWSPRSADRKKRRPKERHPLTNRGTSKQASKKGSRRSKSVSPDSARSPLDRKSPSKLDVDKKKGSRPKARSRETPASGPLSPFAPLLLAAQAAKDLRSPRRGEQVGTLRRWKKVIIVSASIGAAMLVLGGLLILRIEMRRRKPTALKSPSCSTKFCKRLLTWNQRSDYMTRANILRNLEHTKEIRDHLSVSYEDFNGTVNQSRMDEIMDHMSVFLSFADKMAKSVLTPVTFNDSTKFFDFTPTVPQERWRAILNQYLSKPIESYTGVTINGVDYFKAVFEMHKKGEDVMNDIVEALAVQNLVPFTSMEMIRSFHKGQGEESTSALMHTCFELLYPFFGYVVNHLLMHSLDTTELQARGLAGHLRATFINSVTEHNQTLPIGNVSASRSNHTMEFVFGILERSLPSQFPLSYQNYPDITEDPLINWVNLDRYYSNLSSEMKHTIIRYEEADYVTFINFVMMLHYLMFPFAADDAHIGVFTGGHWSKIGGDCFLPTC